MVIRKDLGLSFGKWMAQAVHAVQRTGVETDYDNERYICMVKYVKSEVKLLNLYQKCLDQGVACGLQRDAGLSEIEQGTPSALSIGPDDSAKVDAITKRLQTVKVQLEW